MGEPPNHPTLDHDFVLKPMVTGDPWGSPMVSENNGYTVYLCGPFHRENEGTPVHRIRIFWVAYFQTNPGSIWIHVDPYSPLLGSVLDCFWCPPSKYANTSVLSFNGYA